MNNRHNENITRKGEIARNKQFLLFPQCFLLNRELYPPFVDIFDIISLFAAELEEPKIGISGKEIRGQLNYLVTVLNMFIFNNRETKN